MVNFQTNRIFQQYKMNTGWYVRHNKQLHQSLTARFGSLILKEYCSELFADLFYALYEDVEPTYLLKLIDQHYSVALISKICLIFMYIPTHTAE
jgi:hypothetical protein